MESIRIVEPTAPNQVWSWDITKLLGPVKWTYFYLYVILDIFSRYVVGWMVANQESTALAKRLLADNRIALATSTRKYPADRSRFFSALSRFSRPAVTRLPRPTLTRLSTTFPRPSAISTNNISARYEAMRVLSARLRSSRIRDRLSSPPCHHASASTWTCPRKPSCVFRTPFRHSEPRSKRPTSTFGCS